MSDRKLRPRNKKINYLEVVSYKSPENAVSRREFADRRPPVERNLRPRKVISYKDLDASPFQCDHDYGKYYPVAKEQKEKASAVLTFEDDSDDDEYKSMRETNMRSRFNILKDMGIDTEKTVIMKTPCSKEKTTIRRRTQGSSPWTRRENFPALRSKTRSINLNDSVYTDMMENENVMDVDEGESKLGGSKAINRSVFCKDDDEDEYNLLRKTNITDRLNVLKNIDPNQTV